MEDDEKEELREKFSDSPEYNEILTVCERGKMFEYVAFSLKNQAVDACNKLETYCLSFAPETKGVIVQSVQDYQNKIIGWHSKIKTVMQNIESLLEEHDKYKQKAVTYLGKYSSVISLMRQASKGLVSLCNPIKKWVTSDSAYARRIQEEINFYIRQKMENQNAVKYLDDQGDKVAMQIKRKAFQVGLLAFSDFITESSFSKLENYADEPSCDP